MSLAVWLGIIVFSGALWWFGFIATKQMRLDKNKDRTIMWEKVAAAQKKRREAEVDASETKISDTKQSKQNSSHQD
ncbi:MAG: hypothetical protein R8M46_02430 [Ghiorsea sp.]